MNMMKCAENHRAALGKRRSNLSRFGVSSVDLIKQFKLKFGLTSSRSYKEEF